MTTEEYEVLFCIRYLQNTEPNEIHFEISQKQKLMYQSLPQTGIKLNWNKQRVCIDPAESFIITVARNDRDCLGLVETNIQFIEHHNQVEFQHLENTSSSHPVTFQAYIYVKKVSDSLNGSTTSSTSSRDSSCCDLASAKQKLKQAVR